MITKLGKSLCKMLPLLLGSLAAGAINGLFGMGGGIVIYFILSRLYAQSDEYDAKDIFAMTVISVLIMSLSSVFLYFSSGAFSLYDALPYMLPDVMGGIAGAFAL